MNIPSTCISSLLGDVCGDIDVCHDNGSVILQCMLTVYYKGPQPYDLFSYYSKEKVHFMVAIILIIISNCLCMGR